MWKHLAANTLTFLIICMIGVVAVLGWAQNQYRVAGPLETAVCLRVPSGGSFRQASENLAEMGAISHPMIFRLGADYQGRSHLLKKGSFLIEPGSSMQDIVAQVTTSGRSTCGSILNLRIGISRIEVDLREFNPAAGKFETKVNFLPLTQDPPATYTDALTEEDLIYRVIVSEGVTSWQVLEGLKAAAFLEGAAGPRPAEGSLAPGSYEVPSGTERKALLARMLAEQERLLAEAWENRAPDLPIKSAEEALILASIIEKETSIADERAIVSQVFMNRLTKGMLLQFDPTIIYGITRGEGTLGRPIRQSDLDGVTEKRLHGKIEYNTYQIEGLPAGPIANPGADAIEAAVRPDGSDFLFFVADGTGGHVFSTTYQEHLRHVARLREMERESQDN